MTTYSDFRQLPEKEKRKLCPIPEPAPPARDWRWWSLIIFPTLTAIGLCIFAIFAFAFTELRSIPADTRRMLVITASILVPIGSEIGTVFSALEVYRKHRNMKIKTREKKGKRKREKVSGATAGDWAALVISEITSIIELIATFAWLLSLDTTWHEMVRMYAPLAVGLFAVLDFYPGLFEAGDYLATYDQRHDEWYNRTYIPWLEEMYDREREIWEEKEKSRSLTMGQAVPKEVVRLVKERGWLGDR